jgi:hypothetical protein
MAVSTSICLSIHIMIVGGALKMLTVIVLFRGLKNIETIGAGQSVKRFVDALTCKSGRSGLSPRPHCNPSHGAAAALAARSGVDAFASMTPVAAQPEKDPIA